MNIVFVHLNTDLPSHLIENLRRTQKLFPNNEIYLITNRKHLLPNDLRTILYFVDTDEYSKIFELHDWDRNFRHGFWQTSLIRILVLGKFHDSFPDMPILHIESDVILMNGFPIGEVGALTKVYWNAFGSDSDVGALIYSPNPIETNFLVSSIENEIVINSKVTDMTALHSIRQRDKLRYRTFPSSSSDVEFRKLPYIFDGASLGMWLFGEDPRNHYGYQPRFKNLRESFYQFDKGTVKLDLCDNPVLVKDGTSATIVSFHIHCKEENLFFLPCPLLSKRIRQSSKRFNIPVFKVRVFLRLFFDASKHGEMKGFIYNFPILGKFIQFFRLIINWSVYCLGTLRGRLR